MFALVVLCALAYSASAQLPTNCGTPAIPPKLTGNKIVSNTEATKHSWPWQVQLRYNGGHYCGGSVIANGYVLSAAHCVFRKTVSQFSFRAGRHTRTGLNEPNEQTSAATQIIVHENYSPITINNDITLIRLATPYRFNDYVSPSCLADTEPAAGTDVWVSGWGNVQGTCCDGDLKQAKLPIISRATCQSLWSAVNNIPITEGMLCAGNANGYPSACNGDSGGPLVAQTDANKFVQVGIVSWGSNGCKEPNQPNVYANVARYRSWIVSKINQIEKEEALLSGKFHPRLGAAFRAVAEALEH